MVSPPDKNNYEARQGAGSLRASIDGNAITYSSVGPFPNTGAVGTAITPRYVARRTSGGWVSTSVDPPHEDNILDIVLGLMGDVSDPAWFAPDLSTNLSFSLDSTLPGDAPGSMNLYVHSNQTGVFHRLAQMSLFGKPVVEGVSADGSHIIFESMDALTPDAPSGEVSHLYELDHGTLRFVGVLPDGSAAPVSVAGSTMGPLFPSFRDTAAISEDGSRIVFSDGIFTGDDTNPSATGGQPGQLYMRIDNGLPSAHTVQLDASEKTTPDPTSNGSIFRGASADESRVFFTTTDQLVNADTNSAADLYMYDLNAPAGHHLTLISQDEEPADGSVADAQGVMGMSKDGSRVYFVAASQLVPGAPIQPPTRYGRKFYLYLWENGTLRYISPVNEGRASGDATGWSLSASGGNQTRISDDGRYLLFSSLAHVTSYDSHGFKEMYLYDADTEKTTCISCPPPGVSPSGDAAAAGGASPLVDSFLYVPRNLVEVNGHLRVFFETPDPLVPGDVNGLQDAYEWNSETGSVALLSDGRSNRESSFVDASPNGHDVFIGTSARLSKWDTDNLVDIYDARVNGGLPDPPVAASCEGDACQGLPAVAPTQAAPSSSSLAGPGSRARKRQHKHKRKGHHKRRQASANRRGAK